MRDETAEEAGNRSKGGSDAGASTEPRQGAGALRCLSIALASFWQHYVSVTSSPRFAFLSPSLTLRSTEVLPNSNSGCIKYKGDDKFDHCEIRNLFYISVYFFYDLSLLLIKSKECTISRMSRVILFYTLLVTISKNFNKK